MMKKRITEHLERCVECYGDFVNESFTEPPSREGYEQLRADLMILVGMATALAAVAFPEPSP